MSRGNSEDRDLLRATAAREVRQLTGLGAAYFRAAAGRVGLNATDVEVLDLLGITGPATAGRLAEVTGLTTGAITQMLDRLEQKGLLRREKDPEDGRRVIVGLAPATDATEGPSPIFAALDRRWDELAARYDTTQLALLVEFLQRASVATQEEIARLRAAPGADADTDTEFSASLGDLTSARLVFSSDASQITLRADPGMAGLYHATFEGQTPEVKSEDGTITIRYPRGGWLLARHTRVARVALTTALPWQIAIQGGASDVTAELDGLDLAGLEAKGAYKGIRLELPTPTRVVPIRITGGALQATVRRPAGVAARVHLKGWASTFIFDDQSFTNMGNDVRMQSHGYDPTAPYYDIEVLSSVSSVTITTI